jgi:hypothetical protein
MLPTFCRNSSIVHIQSRLSINSSGFENATPSCLSFASFLTSSDPAGNLRQDWRVPF